MKNEQTNKQASKQERVNSTAQTTVGETGEEKLRQHDTMPCKANTKMEK